MVFIRFGVLVLLFFYFIPSIFAVTLSIAQYPSSFDQQQEIDIGFSLACSSCGDSYIRGVFYPSGTNYFGLTKNNASDWIGTTTDKTQFFKITKEELVGSSWSGMLKVKIDTADANYSGPGQYSFKIGRYTSAESSAVWSGAVMMEITGPTSTPTNTPTPIPEDTPTNTCTPKPTNTSTPMLTKTPTGNPSVTLTITSTGKQNASESAIEQIGEPNVLGVETTTGEASLLRLGEASPSSQRSFRAFIITFIFLGAGCALLSFAFVLHKQFFGP